MIFVLYGHWSVVKLCRTLYIYRPCGSDKEITFTLPSLRVLSTTNDQLLLSHFSNMYRTEHYSIF